MDQFLEQLSTFASSLSYGDIPPNALHGMKRCLVDSFACAVGGRDGEPCEVARTVARENTAAAPAQIFFSAERTTADAAAFANSLMVRYLDCNDTYRVKEGGHPSDAIPAVLAVADALHRDGKHTLEGLVVAYELFAGLAAAENLGPSGIDHCVHTALAAAGGVGRLLELDQTGMANALSIALVSNVSLRAAREGQLSMWKGAAAPHAARNGLLAAKMAAAGMTGPGYPFTGSSGLSNLLGAGPSEVLLGGQGGPFHTDLTNMKFFPAEYHSQAPIWAALDLRASVSLAEVETIDVYTYAFAYHEAGEGEAKWNVRDRETADHSLPYLIAVALLDGDVGLPQFTSERIADPQVHELMRHIRVHEDPDLTRAFPDQISARVEALTSNHDRRVAHAGFPKGHVLNPLSDDEVELKFKRFAGSLWTPEVMDEALQGLWRFERSKNVSETIAAFQA